MKYIPLLLLATPALAHQEPLPHIHASDIGGIMAVGGLVIVVALLIRKRRA